MRFTITQGVHGWQVFDRAINAPIGECFPTRELAQARANLDNEMYDGDLAYEIAREQKLEREYDDYYERHIAG